MITRVEKKPGGRTFRLQLNAQVFDDLSRLDLEEMVARCSTTLMMHPRTKLERLEFILGTLNSVVLELSIMEGDQIDAATSKPEMETKITMSRAMSLVREASMLVNSHTEKLR